MVKLGNLKLLRSAVGIVDDLGAGFFAGGFKGDFFVVNDLAAYGLGLGSAANGTGKGLDTVCIVSRLKSDLAVVPNAVFSLGVRVIVAADKGVLKVFFIESRTDRVVVVSVRSQNVYLGNSSVCVVVGNRTVCSAGSGNGNCLGIIDLGGYGDINNRDNVICVILKKNYLIITGYVLGRTLLLTGQQIAGAACRRTDPEEGGNGSVGGITRLIKADP